MLASVLDRKTGYGSLNGEYAGFKADISSATDYYPFGMEMPGRSFGSENSRFGYRGQEKDNEIRGEGNSINYAFRIHDVRIGRFFAIDPLSAKFPWNSSYAFSENKVIHAIELEGLEAHVLTQNFNSNGDFLNSSFKWDESATPVEDGKVHYYKRFGNKVTHSIADADDINYKGGPLSPTSAPASVLGTDKYYKWRNNDFNVRHGIMDKWYTDQPDPPDYYMGYGNKYVHRFSTELRPKLSSSGQVWLDNALVSLQNAIEIELKVNPSIELNNTKFSKFAFDSHVPSYENSGLFDLPISDLILIGGTPDITDLLSKNGRKQLFQVTSDYIRNAQKNPISTTIRAAEFGYKLYKYFKK